MRLQVEPTQSKEEDLPAQNRARRETKEEQDHLSAKSNDENYTVHQNETFHFCRKFQVIKLCIIVKEAFYPCS